MTIAIKSIYNSSYLFGLVCQNKTTIIKSRNEFFGFLAYFFPIKKYVSDKDIQRFILGIFSNFSRAKTNVAIFSQIWTQIIQLYSSNMLRIHENPSKIHDFTSFLTWDNFVTTCPLPTNLICASIYSSSSTKLAYRKSSNGWRQKLRQPSNGRIFAIWGGFWCWTPY